MNRRDFIVGAAKIGAALVVAGAFPLPVVARPEINFNRRGPLWGDNPLYGWGPLGVRALPAFEGRGAHRSYWREEGVDEWVTMVWVNHLHRWAWLTITEVSILEGTQ